MNVKFLRANNGDAILISFDDDQGNLRNILIDGGMPATYFDSRFKTSGVLKTEIERLKAEGKFIDLLIVTHIDEDHVGGLLSWFAKDPDVKKVVKKVWFNSGRLIAEFLEAEENEDLKISFLPEDGTNTSIIQGKDFEQYILDLELWDRQLIIAPRKMELLGLKFNLLSPNRKKLEKLLKEWKKTGLDKTTGKGNDYRTSVSEHIANDKFKEDGAFPNGSSIAFILTFKEKKMLFLADAHPSVVVESLRALGYSETKKLTVEFVKVSHHGSSGNTSPELLTLIDTQNYIISTSGEVHDHPNKQMLSRIINSREDCVIHFNYPERMKVIFSKDDQEDFPKFKVLPITSDFKI